MSPSRLLIVLACFPGLLFSPRLSLSADVRPSGTTATVQGLPSAKPTAADNHPPGLSGALFSPGGNYLLAYGEDGKGILWNLASGRPERTLEGHREGINAAVFSRDGKKVLTAGQDGTARLWDAKTGEATGRLRLLVEGRPLWAAALSPDGEYAVIGGDFEYAVVFNVADGSFRNYLDGEKTPPPMYAPREERGRHPPYRARALAFSPDGKKLLTGVLQEAHLWDFQRNTCLKTLLGHVNYVWSVAFSTDGKLALTVDFEKITKIWPLEGGTEPLTLVHPSDPTEFVVDAGAFSPDGKLAVTAGSDKTARIWDAATGKPIKTLSGHADAVTGITFSPDGKWLLTSSLDGSMRLWATATWTLKAVLAAADTGRWAVVGVDGSVDASDEEFFRKVLKISGLKYSSKIKSVAVPGFLSKILGDFVPARR